MGDGALAALARPIFSSVLLFRESSNASRIGAQQLQGQLLGLIDGFKSGAADLGIDPREVEEAVFALASWSDSVCIADPESRDQWAKNPLQQQLFGVRDAGSQFYSRLEKLGSFQQARLVFALCLAFGFHGEYSAGESAAILDSQLKLLRSRPGPASLKQEWLSPAAYRIQGKFVKPRSVGLRHILLIAGLALGTTFILCSAFLWLNVLRIGTW